MDYSEKILNWAHLHNRRLLDVRNRKAHQQVKEIDLRSAALVPETAAEPEPNVVSEMPELEYVLALSAGLAKLPSEKMKVIELRYFQQMHIRTVAAQMGRTSATKSELANQSLVFMKRRIMLRYAP